MLVENHKEDSNPFFEGEKEKPKFFLRSDFIEECIFQPIISDSWGPSAWHFKFPCGRMPSPRRERVHSHPSGEILIDAPFIGISSLPEKQSPWPIRSVLLPKSLETRKNILLHLPDATSGDAKRSTSFPSGDGQYIKARETSL